MKMIAPWVVAVALVVPMSGSAALAEESQTLEGSFVWNNENRTGDLEAVFTETDPGRYNVDFRFEWEGKPRVFSGTAEGSLSSGELVGRVQNATKEHTFVFTGSFENGTFNGTHAVLNEEGEETDTGTLVLAR